ncbi:MAG: GNAT family N-acetyltransferase [Butyrivibrio sp.]|nr:GNAT family N-acetyltransferase [Butyrivibrio sp.]
MDLTVIENLSIDRVIKRGTAEIIEKDVDAILLKDTVSKGVMLACDDAEKGMEILTRNIKETHPLLMISNPEIGRRAVDKFGYKESMECYQLAYLSKELPKIYSKEPIIVYSKELLQINSIELTKPYQKAASETVDLNGATGNQNMQPYGILEYRVATMENFPLISREYGLVSEDELKELIERGNIIMGYKNGKAVGFVGEHLEGSIGLLQVFEEYRRKGYGMALEAEMIRRTIKKGYVPFGQVVVDNTASLELQKKLGLTRSEGTIFWMW